MVNHKGQGVRRMNFCEVLSELDTDEQVRTCAHCDRFFSICCQHRDTDNSPSLCHHFPLVFTDDACSRNGHNDAVSGIGGAFGLLPELQWSIPVDDDMDPTGVRTNQRAELLAAIEGVLRLGDFLLDQADISDKKQVEMVVATDSEYVCNAVTDWMPKWKVRYIFILNAFH
jgi:ribonuclease HI